MNIKHKGVALSAAFALTLTLVGNSFAAGTLFTDISNIGAKDKIIALQDKGYVNGIEDGLFGPDKTITAAEGIQLIVNALKLNLDAIRFIKKPKATDYFKKADDNAWYANTLIIASMNGLDLLNDLDPNQEWTCEEFTYHLIQAVEKHANLPMINLVPVEIADEDQITVSYSGAIQRALAYKVTQLDAQGKFNPKAKISRAEAAEQIYNVLEYIKAYPAPNIDQ